jgi:hypothetical protein
MFFLGGAGRGGGQFGGVLKNWRRSNRWPPNSQTISVMTIAKFSTAFPPPCATYGKGLHLIILFYFLDLLFVSHLDSRLPNSTRVNLR